MVKKCANGRCLTTRRHHEGKLFRLDIDLGSMSGGEEQKTEYIWLCAACAIKMHPEVEFTGSSVVLRLMSNLPMQVAQSNASSVRVN